MGRSELLGYVTLTLKFEREQDVWVGLCLELGTSTFADTFEECHSALDALVRDHLDALEEVGERDRFFAEHGIRVHTAGHPQEYTISETTLMPSPQIVGPYLEPRIFSTAGLPSQERGPLVRA